MNVDLLQRLKAASGDFVPAALLGPNPVGVSSDLDEIERFGYLLERHPYLGVAYRGPSPRLCTDVIEWGLGEGRVGRRVVVWDKVSSTNDLAARAAHSSANEGLAILAEEQTAGRGRRGRSWSAPRGTSVLLSVLLFPDGPLSSPGWLTALGAVATAEVVERATGRATRIKWPNDVRVDGRKVAGILVERGAGAILGIGLNVLSEEDDFPEPIRQATTSLRILRDGEPLDRSDIARDLLLALDRLYERGREDGPEAIRDLWRGRLESLGRPVILRRTSGPPVAGRFRDADLEGGLVLDCDGEDESRRFPPAEIQSVEVEEILPALANLPRSPTV